MTKKEKKYIKKLEKKLYKLSQKKFEEKKRVLTGLHSL